MELDRILARIEKAAMTYTQYKNALQTDPLTKRKQKKPYAWNKSLYKELFQKYSDKPNPYRIYLDLDATVADDITPPKEIVDFLSSQGYIVENYLSRQAFSKDGKRQIGIGKLIQKIQGKDSPLLQMYANDPQLNGSASNYMVVISRHPYDILGASTDRGWNSCFNLGVDKKERPDVKNPKRGVNWNYAIADAKHGALIAYLIDTTKQRNDKGKKELKAAARLSIRPFLPEHGGKPILWHSGVVYGTASPSFMRTVEKWLRDNFHIEGDVYNLTPELYDDNSGKFLPLKDIEGLRGKRALDTFISLINTKFIRLDPKILFKNLRHVTLSEPLKEFLDNLIEHTESNIEQHMTTWKSDWDRDDYLWKIPCLKIATGLSEFNKDLSSRLRDELYFFDTLREAKAKWEIAVKGYTDPIQYANVLYDNLAGSGIISKVYFEMLPFLYTQLVLGRLTIDDLTKLVDTLYTTYRKKEYIPVGETLDRGDLYRFIENLKTGKSSNMTSKFNRLVIDEFKQLTASDAKFNQLCNKITLWCEDAN